MTCQDLAPAPGHTPGTAYPAPYCLADAYGTAPQWNHTDSLRLAPTRPSVTRGRRHTTTVLTAWGLSHIRPDAELVVAELLSNALHATHRTGIAAPMGLRLMASPALLAAEVWDASPDPPRLRPPGLPDFDGSDPGEPHGNGMLLVAELSCDWGYFVRPDGGKVVFSLIKI